MGVSHKLLPKIKAFIIAQKKKNPGLSCRKLNALILKKFKINVSKSTISSLIKQLGLSSPIGRRRKPRRSVIEAAGLGSALLKAVDLLLGGSMAINQAIREKLPHLTDSSLLEGLLYLPLFKDLDSDALADDSGLWSLLGKRYTYAALISYLNELQGVKTLTTDIYQAIAPLFQDVWFVKLTLADNSILYLDGQLRTVWSTPNIPYDFASTLYKSNSYINNYFKNTHPLILFSAPGYDSPTKEFFEFLAGLQSGSNKIVKVTLYGNKMEEIEVARIIAEEKKHYLFGVWPWQFEKYRTIEITSDFTRIYFSRQEQDFYLAEAVVKLTQPKINQRLTLRASVLKRSLSGKAILLIVTSIPKEAQSAEAIARLYLNRWPNLEEGFIDFSRKIELFTYTASSRKGFSTETLGLGDKAALGLNHLLAQYLKGLDLYLRWHILPAEYEGLDFSTLKERFFKLKARIKRQKDYQVVKFILPREYPFSKDLAYACQRLNEQEILLPEGRRLWFSIT